MVTTYGIIQNAIDSKETLHFDDNFAEPYNT